MHGVSPLIFVTTLLTSRDKGGNRSHNIKNVNRTIVKGARMHNYYRPLTGDDFRKDESSIIGVLENIKNRKLSNDLQLLNYYKEVPINFAAEINLIDQGLLELSVHQLQAISMQHQKITILRSEHFAHDVLAKVMKVNKDKGLAFLTHFSYAQILTDRRKHVRVKISQPMEASIHLSTKTVKGTINDISISGIAIQAPKDSDIEENLASRISLILSGTKFDVPGKVLRVHNNESSREIAIQMEVDGKNERALSQFIFQTQNEIIREMKDQIY